MSRTSTSLALNGRSAALVEKSCHAIAFASLDGTLVYLNGAGQALVGLSKDDVTTGDCHLQELFASDNGRVWERDVMPQVLDGETWHGECSFRHVKTGELVPVEASVFGTARENGNAPTELVLEAHGLTGHDANGQRVALERQLQHAIKMEAIGRLAGGIAHDFNNLLTAMAGFSEIVLDRLDENDPLREGAEQTLKTCHRSAGMIRQLLAVSRRQVLQPIVMDLNYLIKEMGKLLRELIGEDIEFQVDLSREPATVRADPAQMEQVLLNLVVNARDAMPAGGTLVARSECVNVDDVLAKQHVGARTGPHVRVSVSDTGKGMDRETVARIFEPFFTTKNGKGSGLGLATVYGVVRQSEGFITVDTCPGRGTTFHVYLPSVEEPARFRAEGAHGALSSAERSETILVVEDDNVVRLVVRESLKGAGYHVLEARDGADALGIVAAHDDAVHLLLSDVVMPGMNGPELASRIEGRHPGLRTLFMSGHAKESVLERGVQASELELLEKPFTRAELTRRVRELLAT